jgi:hypothetical protein
MDLVRIYTIQYAKRWVSKQQKNGTHKQACMIRWKRDSVMGRGVYTDKEVMANRPEIIINNTENMQTDT